MKVETMKRAQAIQHRLKEIDEAKRRLQERYTLNEIAAFAGCYGDPSTGVLDQKCVPPAVDQFIRSCGDLLATEEAALRAEFDAL